MRAPTVLLSSLLLCLLFVSTTASQTPNPTSTPAPAISSPEASSAPVPVPEPSAKAVAYHQGNIAIWLLSTLWGWLIPALFLFTGFSAQIRNWAQAIGRKWFLIIGVYFAIFTILNFIIDLPLGYYTGFVREHAYELSNQTFGKWFGDSLKGLAIGIVAGFLFPWVPYLLLRKSPRRWWFYTGLLAIPFLILVILVTPVWIDPLFNKFGPMKNKELETKILALAERAGIEGGRVYEVEKSADTKALNAYVTGFGNTKRIVLWDTTIAKLNENELLFVMGHEMGHYVLGHVWKSILFFAFVIMATLFLIHQTAGWLIKKYGRKFGFYELSDVASLPLILLLFSAYLFIVTPMVMTYTRFNEHESDRFGLEITRNNHDAATAFVKLQTENLAVPRPHWLVRLWRASHPTLGERIDFCNEYRPWEKGQPLQYEHLFKK